MNDISRFFIIIVFFVLFPLTMPRQYCHQISHNLNPPIEVIVQDIRGGSSDQTTDSDHRIDKETEKLMRSVQAKAPQSPYNESSLNKSLKKIIKVIDPVVSDPKFWRLVSESQKPTNSTLPTPSKVQSIDILGFAENKPKNNLQMRKPFMGVDAFPVLPQGQGARANKNRALLLRMNENNQISGGLTPSGLSVNHNTFSEATQNIEKLTQRRRAEPLFTSNVLGDSSQYGSQQLERKAPRHLKDFGISTEDKSQEKMAFEYRNFVEEMLQKPNLVVHRNGTLNKQESTISIGDPESRGIVVFENNSLYDDIYHFITCYPPSPEGFEEFKTTGNLGLSPEERAAETDRLQMLEAQRQREEASPHSLHNNLPEDARMSNKQLREVESLNHRLGEDPNFELTEKETKLMQRAQKYERHKNEFDQNNSNIANDEL